MTLSAIGGIVLTVMYILYLIDILKYNFVKLFAIYIIAMSVLLILEKLTK